MAKSGPKQVYEQGELEKTRKNLGELNPEEARRIASLLGGEVGVEKDSQALSKSYDRISRQNRAQNSRPAQKKTTPKPTGKAASSPSGNNEKTRTKPAAGGKARPPETKPKGGYWARIKSNFLAAKKEHNILSIGSALISLIPFFPNRDIISPRFIKEGEAFLYSPILSLQNRIKRLLSGGGRFESLYKVDPFYKMILETFLDWDPQRISNELSRLENSPRNLSLEDCAYLCRMLLAPIVRLQNLSMESHIIAAIDYYNDLWRKFLDREKDQEKLAILRKDQAFLIEALPRIYKRIHYGCYPLLMKLSTDGYFEYRDFYQNHKPEYLRFLQLTETDLIAPQEPGAAASLPGKEMDAPQAGAPPEEEPDTGEEKNEDRQEKNSPGIYQKGVKLLDELFPQAGFGSFENFPDLFPYFSSFLSFPKNFELLPPEDPLHPLTTLMLISKEFFFGFSSVEAGALKSAEWDLPDLKSSLDNYISLWFRYIEDYIPNLILDHLLDYCRGIEKTSGFEKSDFAKKIESDIYWQKRSLFFPFMKIEKSNFPRPAIPSGYKKLNFITGELTDILETILELSKENPKGGGINNMNAPIRFPIDSLVSGRLKSVLKKRQLPQKNSEFIRCVYWIVGMINELIDDPKSFWYQSSPWPIYRSSKDNLMQPIYNLASLDAKKIIIESDEADEGNVEPVEAAPVGKDPLASPENFLSDLQEILSTVSKLNQDAVLVLLELDHPGESSDIETLLRTSLGQNKQRLYGLSPSEYAILLNNTPAEKAVLFINRIYRQFVPKYGASARLYAGITPLQKGWLSEEARDKGRNTLKASKSQTEPVIALYDDIRKKYRLFAAVKPEEKGENT